MRAVRSDALCLFSNSSVNGKSGGCAHLAISVYRKLVGHNQSEIPDQSGYARDYLVAGHKSQWPPCPSQRTLPNCALEAQILMLLDGALQERIESWAWSGARHGIEYRYPFLDIRLIRFVLGVPSELYTAEPFERQFARRAFSCVLPPVATAYRDKRDLNRTRAFHLAVSKGIAPPPATAQHGKTRAARVR